MGASRTPRSGSPSAAPPGRRRSRVAAAAFAAIVLFTLAFNVSTFRFMGGVPASTVRPAARPPLRHAERGLAQASVPPGTGAAPDQPQFECKRLLWMAGLQAKAADGSQTHYIASSDSYLRYYASALRSARQHAPSLLPVLVVLNDMPQDFIDWVQDQGALVIRHELSFEHRMSALEDKWMESRLAKQLSASYARLDVPAVMQKVVAALPEHERWWQQPLVRLDVGAAAAAAAAASSSVDLDMVLWTDPDVLFRHDIDSCTLPKPAVLSIGPEMRPGTMINCGVMLFNVKAYAAMLPNMLDFADSRKWVLWHDQDLVEKFFKSEEAARFRKSWHRLSPLPDAYNYKPYWGEPAPGWMDMFDGQVGDVAIVHTHGPKPHMSLCVIEYLRHAVASKQLWEPKHVVNHKAKIRRYCATEGAMWEDTLLKIMAAAFKADEGGMYRWVLHEQDRLCPGACWADAAEEWGTHS